MRKKLLKKEIQKTRHVRALVVVASVTRWLDYFSIFGYLQQRKFGQLCTKFAKAGSTCCQIINKVSKICRRLVKFWQRGINSPNLVTLVVAFDQGPNYMQEISRVNLNGAVFSILMGWKSLNNQSIPNQKPHSLNQKECFISLKCIYNGPSPASFSFIFSLFKQQNFYNKFVLKWSI